MKSTHRAISMRKGQPAVFALSALACLMATGCHSSRSADEGVTKGIISVPRTDSQLVPAQMPEPKAVVYRTSGECPELVPVTMTASGKELLSYPAPGDLSSACEPIALTGGWWLDRRGISAASRFTTYTYAEYRAMPEAPAPAEILSHIDDGCVITDIRQLPMTVTEAMADTAAVNRFLSTCNSTVPGAPVASPVIRR